jgi:hypothetical protein
MMPAREPAGLREKVIQMATPAGRIFTRSQSLGSCGIKHALNPPAHTRSRNVLALPDRRERREHVIRADRIKRLVAQRTCINLEGCRPLRAMRCVPETV